MGPLDGVRVVEFTVGIHGPYAAMLLADMGAEVIKVEPPDGDINRRAAVVVGGPYEVGSQFYACNRNKRVACFNLRTTEGMAAAKRLVATADVVVENLRGGALERLGLGYEALAAEHPRLIYASASGWGPKGPRATMASVDIIAQGAGGSVAHTGTPETGPLPTGVALADHAGAVFLALGIMFALYGRERTGRGQRVDTSLFGSQLGMQAWEFSHYLLDRGELPMGGKGHALARAIWHVFDAVDESFVLAWVTDARFAALCEVMGWDDLGKDARFTSAPGRVEHHDELYAAMRDGFREWSWADLRARFEATDQVFSKVNTYADLASHPQALANDYVTSFESAEYGALPMVGFPIGLSETPASVRSRPPHLDEHTAEVLSELGYSGEEIGAMFGSGAVGHPAE